MATADETALAAARRNPVPIRVTSPTRRAIRSLMVRRRILIFGATFIPHVEHVVVVGTKEKMTGVDAMPNITFVANVRSFGNRTVGNKPRKSMGKRLFSAGKFYLPIAIVIQRACPQPTSGWSIFMEHSLEALPD
jgi:hypothetical protein